VGAVGHGPTIIKTRSPGPAEESGSVSWTEARELASPAELVDLIVSGQINVETCRTTSIYSPDVQYRLNEELTKQQVARIAKRAPARRRPWSFL
jgi:hypothetical protein